MKKLIFALPLVLVGGLAAAQTTKPAHHTPMKHETMKAQQLQGEVVSVDTMANKVTVKLGTDEKTLPVEGAAATSFKTLKSGEKVTLWCRDNDKGEHQAITGIEPARTPKK